MANALSTGLEIIFRGYGSKHVLGNIVFSLSLVIMLTQTTPVEATFTQIPVNTSALLGTTAQFNCTADGVAGVTYLVNSMTVINVASIGVTQSIVYSGSQIIAYLYVPVTKDTNNYSVVCFACLLDVTCVYSPPAYLKATAPSAAPSAPSAPQNLSNETIGTTFVALTWQQPQNTGSGGRNLSYIVSYHISGTSRTHNMNTTTTTYYNVTGLSPNTKYTMKVTADNGIPGNETNRIASVTVTTVIAAGTSPETFSAALLVVWCVVVVMAVVVPVLLGLVCIRRKWSVNTMNLSHF